MENQNMEYLFQIRGKDVSEAIEKLKTGAYNHIIIDNGLTIEQIDFIKNLSHEMKTQDNRSTATPYSYRVQQDVQVFDSDENFYCDKVGIKIDGENFDNIEDAIEYYDEDGELSIIGIEDLEEYLNKEDIHYNTYSWEYEERLSIGLQGGTNSFLTEDACKSYIESNKHNLNNPKSYVVHEYRNPEMEKLYEVIHKLAEVL